MVRNTRFVNANRHNFPSFSFRYHCVVYMKITGIISQTSIWSSGMAEEQEREDTWEGDQKHMCFIIPVACHFTTNLISDYL